MKQVRKGNDIKVLWTVKHNGGVIDLAGRKISVYLLNNRGLKCTSSWELKNGVIEVTFLGKDQLTLGVHSLLLIENEGTVGMHTIDEQQAFSLVAHTNQEDNASETVELESDTIVALDGFSAYEIAVRNGFSGTEAEWLASLKGDKGDKGDRGDKGDKGDDADIAAAEEATESANNAATLARQATEETIQATESVKEATEQANDASVNANEAAQNANNAKRLAEEATASANEATRTLTTNANKAIQSANDASASAINAANSANDASASANNAAQLAHSAAEDANTAKESAELAAATASAAATKTIEAVTSANDATANANEAAKGANTAAEKANSVADKAAEAAKKAEAAAAQSVLKEDIVQDLGNATDKVMSQSAVTKKLQGYKVKPYMYYGEEESGVYKVDLCGVVDIDHGSSDYIHINNQSEVKINTMEFESVSDSVHIVGSSDVTIEAGGCDMHIVLPREDTSGSYDGKLILNVPPTNLVFSTGSLADYIDTAMSPINEALKTILG